jgi:hypothetical protein
LSSFQRTLEAAMQSVHQDFARRARLPRLGFDQARRNAVVASGLETIGRGRICGPFLRAGAIMNTFHAAAAVY